MAAELIPYNASLFVDREGEIGKVKTAVGNLLGGKAAEQGSILFRGTRGLGKSWLMFHLKRSIITKEAYPNVLCLFIGLGRNYISSVIGEARPDEWLLEQHSDRHDLVTQIPLIIKRLLIWFAQQIGATSATNAPNDMLTAWIRLHLQSERFGLEHQYDKVVVCIDSVLETDWDLLRALEASLFADLAESPRVLLVMSGRGKKFAWQTPSLRYKMRVDELEAFDAGFIEEQLEKIRKIQHSDLSQKHNMGNVAVIERYSGGIPLGNYFADLALRGKIRWNQAFEELLGIFPSDKRRWFRETLEAICLLDGFREAEMLEMLKLRLNNEDVVLEEAQRRREGLVGQNVASWNVVERTYILDDAMRQIAIAYLKNEETGLYTRLNRRAFEMYTRWADEYKDDLFRERAQQYAVFSGEPVDTANAQAQTDMQQFSQDTLLR